MSNGRVLVSCSIGWKVALFPPNSGRDEWKNHELSHDYDYELLKDRLQTLRDMRKKGDISAMIFNLRTTLSRNLGDMGNEKVYSALPLMQAL